MKHIMIQAVMFTALVARAPAIAGFQEEATFAADSPIPVAPGNGWLLILDETPRTITGSSPDDPMKGLSVKAED